MFKHHQKQGFTLIELLIVVAIIAILAAIALPNFLEAQTRSKVSRVKADLRTIATGLETYHIDWNHYPILMLVPGGSGSVYQASSEALHVMTTPVSYMSSVSIIDPFQPPTPKSNPYHQFSQSYLYISYEPTPPTLVGIADNWMDAVHQSKYACSACFLESWGPNRAPDNLEWLYLNSKLYIPLPADLNGLGMIYDPTNGTVSVGDIGRIMGSAALPQINK